MEDLRSFLKRISSENNLVKRYSQKMRLRDISNIIYGESTSGNILLFENITDYNNRLIVANTVASKEILALALGCDSHELISYFLSKINSPQKPQVVNHAPFEKVSYHNDQVDIFKLPILTLSEHDASPYITAGLVIVKDPESGIQNTSINRLQVIDKDKLLIRAEKHSDLNKIISNSALLNLNKLPIAVCIGNHPIELLVAACGFPFENDELWFSGALRSKSLACTETREYQLIVPALTEILLEGYINLQSFQKEGPFADFLGFYVGSEAAPVIRITTISHVDSPLYQTIRPGSQEDTVLLGFWKEIKIYKTLKSNNIHVERVNIGPNVLICRIMLSKKSDDEVWKAAKLAFECYPWLKICILLDADMDVENENDLWWSLVNRWLVKEGSRIYETIGVNKKPHEIYSHGIAIDATQSESFKTPRAKPIPVYKNKK